jgi:hypothetical protein
MGAPLGNRFWEARSKHGRSPVFASAPDLWNACIEYFEWVEDNPLWASKTVNFQGAPIDLPEAKMRAMTIDGLCLFLDITDQTLYNYKNRGEDFLEVITKAEKVIKYQKFTGAAADLLNANIIARDLGLREQTSNEHTGANGGAIKTESTLTPSEAYLKLIKGQ